MEHRPFSCLLLDVVSAGPSPGLGWTLVVFKTWTPGGAPPGDSAWPSQPLPPACLWRAAKALFSIWSLGRTLFSFAFRFFCPSPSPLWPQGWGEPEGWGSLLARLKFAGWEFFRVLIKRNHPERDDFTCSHTHPNPALSSARIHTLPPPPSPRELCKGAGGRAHGKGRILGVCQRAKCRRRAFLAFFPFLVQCCCGCSFPCWFPPR